MKSTLLHRRWLILLSITLLLAEIYTVMPTPAAAEPLGGTTPTTMVSANVSTYTLAAPRIIWHTASNCLQPPGLIADGASPAASDTPQTMAPEDPELISRIFTSGGLTRILFNRNDPRPISDCNPYHIYSNVVADDQYLYWADDTGLVRLSVNANLNDSPTLVSDLIQSSGNGHLVELAENTDYIFAITYPSNSQSTVHRIHKGNGFHDVVAAPFSGIASDLKVDNQDYAYWRVAGALKKAHWDLFSYVVDQIATGVTGYYPEGLRSDCGQFGCVNVHYVYFAQGGQVRRYNNLTNSTGSALYTSSSNQNPAVYDMVTSNTQLFLLERRDYEPCPGCLIQYNQVVIRTGRAGGTAVPLYEHLSPLSITLDTVNLQEDGSNLYWQTEDSILRLPNDAAALPQTNMNISRIEVTQGIQTITNNVDLIAGRRTFVRVHGRAASGTVSGVTAFLYRVHPITQQPIGDPLAPVNTTGINLTVSSNPTPELLDGAFLFELPMSWVDGSSPLRLKAVINPYNAPIESNTTDNALVSPTFNLATSPRLEVDFYIIGYTDNNNVTHFPNGITDVEQTFSWIRRTYPIANTPGYLPGQAPGFQPNVHYVIMDDLDLRLNGTHPDCQGLSADDMPFCATNYILSQLEDWQDRDYEEEESPVYHIKYGMFDTAAGFNRGRGRSGTTFFGRLYGFAAGPSGVDCCGDAWDLDPAYTDWYTAHELGHALGRKHPDTGLWCGHVAGDFDYPYSGSRIGPDDGSMWAFNAGDAYFGAPRQVGTSKPGSYSDWHDMMGYCDYQWPSDYTYNALYDAIWEWQPYVMRQQLQPAMVADVLRIYGTLLPDSQQAQIHSLYRETEGIPTTNDSGEFAIRLVNAQGQTLAEYPFVPDADEDGFSGQSFGAIVPFVNNTSLVQIVKLAGNTVWYEQPVSANAPTVSNITLLSATNPVTGTVTVEWTAVDADSDPLTFDLLYSQDNGDHFQPLRTNIGENHTQIDTTLIGGGSTILRVVANDGVLTGMADAAPVVIAAKPPQPLILNPGDGTHIAWGQLVNFIGEALDVQDNSVNPNNMVWSNQYGVLGTGGILSIADLPVGVNEITLTATNSAGLSASAHITIVVGDDGQLPGPTLIAGPSPVGWHVALDETAPQTADLTIGNAGSGVITWTLSSDVNWLTLNTNNGTTPATATITADPTAVDNTGVDTGATHQAVLTLIGTPDDGSPVQMVTIPVTLKMGNTWGEYTPPLWQLYLPVIVQ